MSQLKLRARTLEVMVYVFAILEFRSLLLHLRGPFSPLNIQELAPNLRVAIQIESCITCVSVLILLLFLVLGQNPDGTHSIFEGWICRRGIMKPLQHWRNPICSRCAKSI